jgi:hypothetical protein
MAKCSIIFEDTTEGGVEMKVVFNPPINNPLKGHPTTAQNVGWQLAEAMMKDCKLSNQSGKDDHETRDNHGR